MRSLVIAAIAVDRLALATWSAADAEKPERP